jgi:hypothetical protein
MVRDKYGRKMSKSLGNVIDPLEVINGCTLGSLIEKIEGGNVNEKEVGGMDRDIDIYTLCIACVYCTVYCILCIVLYTLLFFSLSLYFSVVLCVRGVRIILVRVSESSVFIQSYVDLIFN